jgi:hypothetical protein
LPRQNPAFVTAGTTGRREAARDMMRTTIAARAAARPFRLPWEHSRPPGRPVIGDALVLHFMLHGCSVRDMTELTLRQARELLAAWAAERDAVTARRDEVVRAAVSAGVSKSEVHRLTGIARSTLDRIIGAAAGEEAGDA